MSSLRILQINSGSENFGGVSSLLYNIYTHIDTEKVQFDFLSPEKTTYGIHREEIEQMGGRIFALGITGNILTKKLKLYKQMKKFLAENPYQIVHIHSGNFFFNLFASAAVKRAGVPFRILHSHSAGDMHANFLKKTLLSLLRPFCERNATQLMACSEIAARYMFTSDAVQSGKVRIVPNGIETDRFAYNPEIRQALRKKMNLEQNFVIGCVARLMPEKNHDFLLDVFKETITKNPDAVLVLIGQGQLEADLRQKAGLLGIEDKVLFLGQRSDTDKLYQMMDVFVLPSIHEGFGIVIIEAQSAGLWCITSDMIPQEANVTGRMKQLSLTDSCSAWADALLQCTGSARENMHETVKSAGYDITVVAGKLEQYYLSLAGTTENGVL